MTLLYNFIHSFIINVNDNEIKTHFTEDKLYEIKSTSRLKIASQLFENSAIELQLMT